jgi:leader peptidase (prepilin peptidase)/N-methyltransferase
MDPARSTERIASGLKQKDLFERCCIGFIAFATVFISVLAAPGARGMLGAGLGLLMLAIAVADARYFIIPNELTAAALGVALVNAAIQEWETALGGILDAALRGTVFAAIFLALRMLYRRIRQRQGIGLGDVKLAGVAGAWLGWTTIPIAVEIAALAALAGYGMRQYIYGRPVQATQRVPFGLFFAPAIWLCWVLEATLLAR